MRKPGKSIDVVTGRLTKVRMSIVVSGDGNRWLLITRFWEDVPNLVE